MINNETQVDQKRFVFAMIISGVVILVWQMFFAPPMPMVQPEEQEQGEQALQTATNGQTNNNTNQVAQPVVNLATPEPTQPVQAKPAFEIREDVMETDHFKVTLSNKGGRVKGVEILKPAQYHAAGDLLKEFPRDSSHFLYEVGFQNNSLTLPKDVVFQMVESESVADGEAFTKLVYRYSDPQGRFFLDKIYTTKPDVAFRIDLDVKLTNRLENGRISDNLTLSMYGYNDPEKETSFLDVRPDEAEAICRTVDGTERELTGSVETPISFTESPTIWGGIDTRYFLFAAVPQKTAEKCVFEIVDTDYLRTQLVLPEFSTGPQESAILSSFELFLAPKDLDLLDAGGHDLGEAVDYGFFTFLARPMRYFLAAIYGVVGNWGFAILILTILIRLLMWPINKKVYVNSERMKEIQPLLAEVKKKYENDQTRMSEETMKVFKENNVSALGCAPMFLQFPIFLSLYYMILNSTELYQANFMLWYTDLSASDPYFVLPILMGFVMFAQQSMMTIDSTGANAQAQQMMKLMPIIFTVFMLFLPSGVVLYYSASMLIGIAQQYWIKRSFAQKKAASAAT